MTLSRPTIFVNGAAGGIGAAGIVGLAEQGFRVIAGTPVEAELNQLGNLHSNIAPVQLDILSGESIESAYGNVEQLLDGQPLFGLWNNAGISAICAFKNMVPQGIRKIIEINLLGTMLFLNRGITLLARNEGRVVITGSATGMLGGPAVSVYSATKWGLEGFTDALRIELGQMGISTSLIQPGLIKTPMSDSAKSDVDALVATLTEQDREDFGGLVEKIADVSLGAKTTSDKVARAVVRAFTDKKPKSRYRVGPDATAVGLIRHLPDGVKDAMQRKIFGL